MLIAGYHLLSLMYGDVTYVPRSEYATRERMLQQHAVRIEAAAIPGSKVIRLTASMTFQRNGSVDLSCPSLPTTYSPSVNINLAYAISEWMGVSNPKRARRCIR